jgi:AcrR family transcriptional regulator
MTIETTTRLVASSAARPEGVGRPSARDRLLAAANELFYAEGVQSVGIDRIVERAGVAKASLYNLFGSKEGLVRAYLESRHNDTAERITAAVARQCDPLGRLLAVFEVQGEIFAEPDFQGCAFIAATAETAHGRLIDKAADAYRAWILTLFTDLSTQAGAANPDRLARQLQVIYDGAGVAAHLDHDPSIAQSARAAAQALLEASS